MHDNQKTIFHPTRDMRLRNGWVNVYADHYGVARDTRAECERFIIWSDRAPLYRIHIKLKPATITARFVTVGPNN